MPPDEQEVALVALRAIADRKRHSLQRPLPDPVVSEGRTPIRGKLCEPIDNRGPWQAIRH